MNPAQAAANYKLLVDLKGEDRAKISELVNQYFVDDDPELAVANSPPAKGKVAIIAAYEAFFGMTDAMDHRVECCFSDEGAGSHERADVF